MVRPGCFFFFLWPFFAPFCSCPVSLVVSRIFVCCRLSSPSVQSFFFWLRPVGRRDLSAGPEPKKQNTQFCSGPGERQGKEKPRWAPARGQSKKKQTPWVVFFFCAGPAERSRRPTGRNKKNTLHTRGRQQTKF